MTTENPVLALREALEYQAHRICVTFRGHTPPTCETHWSEWPIGADSCEWRQRASTLIAAVRAETLAGDDDHAHDNYGDPVMQAEARAADFRAETLAGSGDRVRDQSGVHRIVNGMLCEAARGGLCDCQPATPPTPALTAARLAWALHVLDYCAGSNGSCRGAEAHESEARSILAALAAEPPR